MAPTHTSYKTLEHRYACWAALKRHRRYWRTATLQSQFAQDPDRSRSFTLAAAGLQLDYSRNPLNHTTLALWGDLWKQAKLPQAIEALLSGAIVNGTEQRAAHHSALRHPQAPREVAECLQRMSRLVEAIRSGQWKGFSGQPMTDVVHIGIGGSDLGPRMATHALASFNSNQSTHSTGLRCHFVANIDPQDLTATLASLRADTTVFVVASKSFSTLETLSNGMLAREWFLQQGSVADIPKHFMAVSTAVDKAKAFGIAEENIFPLWDWVGGRYSLWSAIGLPIALSIGMENFRALLSGAHAMDEHFRHAPLPENLPGILGLLEIWYSHFFDAQTHAVLPYSHALRQFPEFLQQLEMESNGKQVDRQGKDLTYPTGSVVWGSAGTIGQHSFHQLLHQGTAFIPVDFILPLQGSVKGSAQVENQHRHLVANGLAQSQALLMGEDLATVKSRLSQQGLSTAEINKLAPHKVIPGNRPHNLITMDALTPETLGALIALYEHKVYVQSVILNINAFDQWGVELGKQLSQPIYEALGEGSDGMVDPSIQSVVARYRALHDENL